MMQSSVIRYLLVSVFVLLSACSGEDDITGFTDFSELRLSSLSVVSGGTLRLNGNDVEEFDPSEIGPYSIRLDNRDVSEVTIVATLESSEDRILEIIERGKGEDGLSRRTTISSGESHVLTINEGSNIASVRVSSTTSPAFLDYTLQINRTSSSAALSDFIISGVSSTQTSELVEFTNGAAAPDVFEYDVTVDSSFCEVALRVVPESAFSRVTIDGESVGYRETVYLDFEPGTELPIEVVISSQADGENGEPLQSQTYRINVTSSERTEEQIASETRLSSIELSEGRTIREFRCQGGSITEYRLSTEVSSVSLTVVAEQGGVRDETGQCQTQCAQILLSTEEFNDEGDLVLGDPFAVLGSGIPYSGQLVSELAEGENRFVFFVTSPDGSASELYSLVITRSTRREIYVETAAELQQAMLTANSNDYIFIAPGKYTGVVMDGEENPSGHPNAHFYSDRPGVVNSPIRLIPESGDVELVGDSTSQFDVLRLKDSQYWIIAGIKITGGQNGIVLDGTDNTVLEQLLIEDVGERGIVLENGASSNRIFNIAIDNTGVDLQARDGIDELYGEGIVVGEGEGISQDNDLRNIIFGRNILTEHIDVKANSDGTLIQANMFEVDNTISALDFTDRNLVRLTGGDTEFSLNDISYDFVTSGEDEFSAMVYSSPNDGATVDIFENLFDLDGQNVALVEGGQTGLTTVDGNRVEDGSDPIYQGVVDETGFISEFKIQSTRGGNNCLMRTPATISFAGENSTTQENLVTAQPCSSDRNQFWALEHVNEGYTHIVLADDPSIKWVTLTPARGATDVLAVREDDGSLIDAAYFLQWQLSKSPEGINISSRSGASQFVYEEPSRDTGLLEYSLQPIFVAIPSANADGDFIFLRQ